MNIESGIMIAICGFIIMYLFYALLRPEKF
jgi:K+-transporting ATPase KdpF subunit